MPDHSQPVGFGAVHSPIRFYIANRPPLDDYPSLDRLQSLVPGEIAHIVQHTSNHWRKVFNVLAKVLFDWYGQQGHDDLPESWQAYRDQVLLQSHSQEALLFSAPDFSQSEPVHIVLGKTYAAALELPPLNWLDSHFAVNQAHRLVVSPYPDYRQLSNERIGRLIELIAAGWPLLQPPSFCGSGHPAATL
ncbi:MAG: hypothetical protein JXQ97_07880 [Natronospirillum sp.]